MSNGTCGCDDSSQCQAGFACLRGTCTTSCDLTLGAWCNGGCCLSGVCEAGTSPKACGQDGLACATCTVSLPDCCAPKGGYAYCTTAAECAGH